MLKSYTNQPANGKFVVVQEDKNKNIPRIASSSVDKEITREDIRSFRNLKPLTAIRKPPEKK